MKKEDKEAYISYRLEKADETLEVAGLLVENQSGFLQSIAFITPVL